MKKRQFNRKNIAVICLVFALIICCVIPAVAAEPAEVNFKWKLDGQKATVMVSVVGCDAAKAMMLTPIYDSSVLKMTSGKWKDVVLEDAAMKEHWKEKEPRAVFAFIENLPLEGDIFEMSFDVIGENAEAALEKVKCRVVIKTESGGKEIDFPVNVEGLVCEHKNTVQHNEVASGCEIKGYTAGTYCNDCREYISGHEETAPAGHSYDNTWSQDVNGHWKVCEKCGYSAPSVAHVPGDAATATQAQLCLDCGYILAEALGTQGSVPPPNWSYWEDDSYETEIAETEAAETEAAETEVAETEAAETEAAETEAAETEAVTEQLAEPETEIPETDFAEIVESDTNDETQYEEPFETAEDIVTDETLGEPEQDDEHETVEKTSSPSASTGGQYYYPIMHESDVNDDSNNSATVAVAVSVGVVAVAVGAVCLIKIKKRNSFKRKKGDKQ